MIEQTRALVEKKVRQVSRRMLLQVVGHSLVLCLAVGLLACTFWFLLRPFVWKDVSDEVRYGVAGAIIGLSVVAGCLLGWMRRPNQVAASLLLDERFELKERVTTLFTLPDELLRTQVGEALLRDVTAQLTAIQVAAKFPLQIDFRSLALPAGAFVLALAAAIVDPYLSNMKFGQQLAAEELIRKPVETKEIQKQLDTIKKVLAERKADDPLKSEALKELEREFEKLLNQPVEKNEEKIRERVNEMRKLEDKMKERLEGLREKAEKIDALKKQLEKLGFEKDHALKDGPAKDFEDALSKGQLDKAKTALDKLIQDLKNDKLSDAERKDLAEQFQKLADKLSKMDEKKEMQKKLEKAVQDGKMTKEQAKEAMDKFNREMEQFKDLQELADIVGECKKCLGENDKQARADKLDQLMKQIGESFELSDQEIRDLLRDQNEVGDAMRALLEGLNRDENADPDGDGMQGGEFPGARRPISKDDPNSKIKDERQRAEVDPKGQQRITGYARGGTFKKVPPTEVEGAFQRAAQAAPEAIDRQRIPDDAAEITRRYFNKLGNQK